MRLELRAVGRRAVLVEVADPEAARSLASHVRAAVRTGVLAADDVVPGAASVLIDGVGERDGQEALAAVLAQWQPGTASEPGPLVEVEVVYDGPDLADVAQRWGTDEAGVVARHTGVEYVATFCGFSPGFAYLAGLPEKYAVPRLDSPRASVPVGSVGLAGNWCGVYPTASPAGWRLLGRTEAVLWDPGRSEPALLSPGTRVRFVPSRPRP